MRWSAMNERRKLSGFGTGTYEEKRSRFIGDIFPVSGETQAREYLAQVKKKYPDARHHCWAWVLPDGSTRWSDDGEPGGTAGGPMAAVLKGANVYGVLCVVTRYFGGTLLGSGGLVRAYSKAAALALADAGTEPDPEKTALAVSCPWDSLDRVHRLIRELGGAVLASDYESDPERALLTVELLAEQADSFIRQAADSTGGRAAVKGPFPIPCDK